MDGLLYGIGAIFGVIGLIALLSAFTNSNSAVGAISAYAGISAIIGGILFAALGNVIALLKEISAKLKSSNNAQPGSQGFSDDTGGQALSDDPGGRALLGLDGTTNVAKQGNYAGYPWELLGDGTVRVRAKSGIRTYGSFDEFKRSVTF